MMTSAPKPQLPMSVSQSLSSLVVCSLFDLSPGMIFQDKLTQDYLFQLISFGQSDIRSQTSKNAR